MPLRNIFYLVGIGMEIAFIGTVSALKVKNNLRGETFMKKEQGFSLIELLIVVAIIAIIAAIAVPSMLQARMAANESGAIQGCRTVGSAEVAYAAINNQSYASKDTLVTGGFLDSRFTNGFSGYTYADGTVTGAAGGDLASGGFGVIADTTSGKGRYKYGIGADQVVRYEGLGTGVTAAAAKCGTADCVAGDAIGSTGSGS
jgi:prepilin-type N-terminal cleavage/methylation domain-containing protein